MSGQGTAPGATIRWAMVPSVEPESPRRRGPVVALAAFVAVVPPVFRMFTSGAWERGSLVAAVLLVATALMSGVADRRWPVRLGIAVAAGVLASWPGGIGAGLWGVGTLVLSDWAIRRRPPFPFLPEPDSAVVPGVVVLGLVAAWRGDNIRSFTGPLLFVGSAYVLTLLGSLVGDRVSRVIARFSTAVGRAVVRGEFLLLGLVVVAMPRIGSVITRSDVFRAPHPEGSAWVPVGRRRVEPTQLFAPSNALLRLSWGERLRRFLAPLVSIVVVGTVGLVIWALVPAVPWPGGDGENPDEVAKFELFDRYPAYEGVDWWPAYQEEMSWLFSTAFDPMNIPRVKNVEGRFFNVTDGVRASWVPPDCGGCRRVKVWVYGGSTGFGLGQRDEHTIASEVARLAWRDGVAVDVSNRGVPGDLHWMEAQHFAWDVLVDGPPDVVVFYDGINDMGGALNLQDLGRSTDIGPIDPTLERARVRDLAQFGYVDGKDPDDGPGDARVVPPVSQPWLEAGPLGRQAVERYDESRRLSREVAERHGVPIVWFWQPSVFTGPWSLPVETEGFRWSRDWWAAAVDALPDDVFDLSDAFDDLDEPVYYDEMHHNELGAKVVAEGIYRRIRPEIVAVAGGGS